MPLFGMTLNDYLGYAKFVIIVTVAVGVVRLALSLADAGSIAVWFSLNVVGLLAMIYFAVSVHTSGFGSYKQLLVLLLIQGVVSQVTIGLGVAVTPLTGIETVYSQAEMAGVTNPWIHAGSHVVIAPLFAGIGWIPAAVIMFVTK